MKKPICILVCAIALFAQVSRGFAQQIQIFSTSESFSDSEGRIKEGIKGQMMFAAPGMGQISLGGIDPNNASALFGLLNNESVRNELKLTDVQHESAAQIMKESQEKLSNLVRSNLADGKGFKGSGLRELMEEMKYKSEAAIEEILLPDQMKRLRQLAYYVDIARSGLGEALISGRLGTDLGVVENQKASLLEKATRLEAQVQAEIARIRQMAQSELFKELSSEQRQKAEELLGNYFGYQEPTLAQSMKQGFKKALNIEKPKSEKPTK